MLTLRRLNAETEEQFQQRLELTQRIKQRIPTMADNSCITIATCICNKYWLNVIYPPREELAISRIIDLIK